MATHLLLFSPQLYPQSVCIYKCPTFQLLNSKSQFDHTSHFSYPLKDFSCHLCSNVTSSSVAPSSVFFFTVIYFLTASLLQLSKPDPSHLSACFFPWLCYLFIQLSIHLPQIQPWPLQPLPIQELWLLRVNGEKLQNYAVAVSADRPSRTWKFFPCPLDGSFFSCLREYTIHALFSHRKVLIHLFFNLQHFLLSL